MHILDRIMARKREEVAERRRHTPEARLLAGIKAIPPSRGFVAALRQRIDAGDAGIIAEVKRASPSKGLIIPPHIPFDPTRVAAGYAENGAVCISCLTDRDFFQGDEAFIEPIRARTPLPVLRKDFLYDPYQVVEARAIGADAILLIMAVLDRAQARELEAAAVEFGLDVLVEVHDERELEAAHDLDTPLLGINNRNLKTFETSLQVSIDLAARAETGKIIVSESGIHSTADIKRLRERDIHAFLIGEAFMRQADPGRALGEMLAGEGTN